MNWLSHLLLSDATPQFRVGNLLPDLMRLPDLQLLSPQFRAGIACHRAIDSYTDSHPIFRASVSRIEAPFRRYGGVLVDVFYDHFLTRDWEIYAPLSLRAPLSLDDFVSEVYASFDEVRDALPTPIFSALEAMRREDWLRSYGEIGGIEITLGRISRRLRRPFPLRDAVRVLETDYDALQTDFRAFFPQLVARVRATDFFD